MKKTRNLILIIVVVIVVLIIFFLKCSGQNDNRLSVNDETILKSYEQFKSQAYEETFQGTATGIYIVDGDTPVNSDLRMKQLYAEYVKAYNEAFNGSIVNSVNGVDVVWSDSMKTQLTYCISDSFGANKLAVIMAMSDATAAWESAANVNFIYVQAEDAYCTSSNYRVMFDVNPTSGQNYLARSFFPNDPRWCRNIMINSSSFNVWTPLTLTGILRHELGHSLGLRHEHTRPESGTCFEDNNWRALTSYDAASVMGYPQCNGAGDLSFILTDLDKIGIAKIYGKSLSF